MWRLLVEGRMRPCSSHCSVCGSRHRILDFLKLFVDYLLHGGISRAVSLTASLMLQACLGSWLPFCAVSIPLRYIWRFNRDSMSVPSRTPGLRLGNSINSAWILWLAAVIVPVIFPPKWTIVLSAMTAVSPLSATSQLSRRYCYAFSCSR